MFQEESGDGDTEFKSVKNNLAKFDLILAAFGSLIVEEQGADFAKLRPRAMSLACTVLVQVPIDEGNSKRQKFETEHFHGMYGAFLVTYNLSELVTQELTILPNHLYLAQVAGKESMCSIRFKYKKMCNPSHDVGTVQHYYFASIQNVSNLTDRFRLHIFKSFIVLVQKWSTTSFNESYNF